MKDSSHNVALKIIAVTEQAFALPPKPNVSFADVELTSASQQLAARWRRRPLKC